MKRTLPALALVALLAACGSDSDAPAATGEPVTTTSTTEATTTTTEAAESCSALVLSDTSVPAQDVPAPVAATRERIIEAALACDFDGLEALSLEGDGTFKYSFGATESAGGADFWREREAEGDEVLRTLVEKLREPYVLQGDIYTWPEAFAQDGYLGYRAGITSDGDWQYFVAGD